MKRVLYVFFLVMFVVQCAESVKSIRQKEKRNKCGMAGKNGFTEFQGYGSYDDAVELCDKKNLILPTAIQYNSIFHSSKKDIIKGCTRIYERPIWPLRGYWTNKGTQFDMATGREDIVPQMPGMIRCTEITSK
ncbi:MAG: hypothetical protein AAF518_26390 [Spirochaetota bacterium]